MGKNNKLRKPPAAAGGGSSSSSESPGLGLGALAITAAVFVIGLASFFVMLFGSSGTAEPLAKLQRAVKQAAGGKAGAGEVRSDRERLQEGALDKKGARCADTSRKCARDVSAEACSADERLRQRCCRSCHMLTCVDHDAQCEEWAFTDQCLDNPEYMQKNCCWSCSPDPDDPCSIDPSDRPDVYKGDIDKTFERILAEYQQYPATVHSRDPWLISLDNVLSDDECAGIIEAVGGTRGEYIKPSTTAKPVRQANGQVVLTDVPDNIRTSHNAWCQHRSCYNHPVHERVIQRIMDIVGLHPNNAEHMQLLRYGPNEYYRLHHDWIPEQLDAACGPRAFTFFLYLSDVEAGGGTQFPYINKTVMPKKGSAVLWPHGLNSDPRIKDTRTHHEAMPVLSGTKWGANYWIHGRDFKTSMASGCDGRQGQPKRSRLMRNGAAEKRLAEDKGQRQSSR